MKRIIIILIAAMAICSCGVGSYSVTSGKEDIASLSFTAASSEPVLVVVDGSSEFSLYTVKQKAYKADRKIKSTVQNTITLSPGQHDVTVYVSGQQVYSKKLFLSASEHRVIDL